MKKLVLSLIGGVAIALSAQSQQIIPGITNILGAIDDSTNYFSDGEISLEIGGVYVQKTGEGGVLLDLAKWDVGIKGLGIGGQFIDSASQPAAEFGYLAYRKTLGNTAIWGFSGFGYNEIDKRLMGVAGVGLEHRFSKHISAFTKVGYGFQKGGEKRGMVVGAGTQYSF